MPFERERYPADWEAIRRRILALDKCRCAFCGKPHGGYVEATTDGTWRLPGTNIWYDRFHRVAKVPKDRLVATRYVQVVLTIAHLGVPKPDGSEGDPADKMDCRDENLAALCQRCHLNFDMHEHAVRAATTRLRKRRDREAAAGQTSLLKEDDHATSNV